MKETKLAFFDIDGTLAVPRYKVGEEFVSGFTDEGWRNFCDTHPEDGYEYCIPVNPVVRYARELKESGAVLFVLSTSQSEGEHSAKRIFIEKTFPGLFAETILVPADRVKLEVIREKAKEKCELDECELIEDTYSTILKANELGIKVTHISAIVCDL